jgi:hypothetical protein
MAKQDVDQSSHPDTPGTLVLLLHTHSSRLLQPFLPGTMPGLAIRSERRRTKIWGKPAPLLPFCTINSSLHCFGSRDT